MKYFKDLKDGDIIYYYDHCKMKPREILSIQEEIEEISYGKLVNKYTYLKIIFKNGKYIRIHTTWDNGLIDDYMDYKTHYFSCKEAAQLFLDQLTNKRIYKINKCQEIIDRYTKYISQYGFEE